MNIDSEFEIIYKEYYLRIHNYMTRMTGPFLSEDLTQEVFHKIHNGLPAYRGNASLSTWIYRIATNTAIDKTRTLTFQHDKKAGCDDIDKKERVAIADIKEESSDKKIIKEEMSDCVKEFIQRLPDKYKTVLILREYAQKSNKQIAQILDISLGTVKIRLHRAKAMLKKELNRGCDFYYDDQNVLSCDRKQSPGILLKIPE